MGSSETTKRDRIQIMAELMAAADGEMVKTRLMYRSNLDSKSIRKYLQYLLEKGFLTLEEGGEHPTYQRTVKGWQFLQEYREVATLLA